MRHSPSSKVYEAPEEYTIRLPANDIRHSAQSIVEFLRPAVAVVRFYNERCMREKQWSKKDKQSAARKQTLSCKVPGTGANLNAK